MSAVTYFEAIVVGALQGVSELFPVSSLGHSILLPAWIGGKWADDLSMGKDSPYLAVLVAMHVATAIALVVFFWRDWVRIIRGLWTSIRDREVADSDQRLAWLLVLATIPVGIGGLLLESALRNFLGKPVPTAIFLALNGVVLLAVERFSKVRKEPAVPVAAEQTIDFSAEVTMPMRAISVEEASDRRLSKLGVGEAVLIGAAQILALLPGISRSGITMVAGLRRGLDHEDAARFAFLLATPVILAAGVLKMPSLFAPENSASLGPALVGSLVAGIAAYIAVRFLTSYFETRTLTPFAVYCVIAGIGSLVYFLA
ncbi:undecaprenyl-diphosphate phosphatase [Amycolatopsis acidiphila]|uniref:Undecaprenyl-diphosphatase n=1 Tax=Amycolatopsis acidiphila TaxID=715473 RepID=A0A558A168_9PSEU|nr:undecaprenyl-diphosphate phosphatase [Amycolatopsis acidiphila]TVT18001.1 undecaprenyl-diphosphate phosphatase [Amycolatopsis acidiphila]UIJ61049.1 undecaprenyl-diphosphate phosphatase [Amycolatopsis acidiphila]GHG89090.1 undecaprenyl-diphosphatase [Amycolatopsis acidiphila]